MTIKKFDYSKSTDDIFYKVIYPLYAREFLFGRNYESFAFLVEANFILNAPQWEYILEHWEQKERILTIEDALNVLPPLSPNIVKNSQCKTATP